jgi:hypothetical protein
MLKFIGLVALFLCAGSVAVAHDDHDWTPSWWHRNPVAAPEIDPASALSGLTLLVGGLAVVRGRRGK